MEAAARAQWPVRDILQSSPLGGIIVVNVLLDLIVAFHAIIWCIHTYICAYYEVSDPKCITIVGIYYITQLAELILKNTGKLGQQYAY